MRPILTPEDGMKKLHLALLIFAFSGLLQSAIQVAPARGLRVEILFSPELSSAPLDGRMFLFISRDLVAGQRGGGAAGAGGAPLTTEPRFQVSDQVNTQQMFAVDVDVLKA